MAWYANTQRMCPCMTPLAIIGGVLTTSVSRGWFNDGVPWLQPALLLCLLNHPQSNAVLHRATSIEELTLAH